MANLTRLIHLQDRLFSFLAKNNLTEFKVSKLNRSFEDNVVEDRFQNKLQEYKSQKGEYSKLAKEY